MGKLSLPSLGKIDTLGILFTLLPGLLTYVIVHALSSREKKYETAEVLLHGLAYTLIVHAIWQLAKLPGSYIPTPDIAGLCITSVVSAVVIAAILNNGITYSLLQKLGVTRESAWESTWKTTFREAWTEVGEYAHISLDDESTLVGAVRYYSSTQSDGHVTIQKFYWIDPISNKPNIINEGLLLIPASKITMVHFLPNATEDSNDGQAQSDQAQV